MKKYFVTFLIASITFCLLAVSASAQIKITTKKMKLSDFLSKTTKVVLTGSSFYDEALKEEVSRHWRISPYEFCSIEEYEKLKGGTDYYFLAIMDSKSKKEAEPGICVLTVFRGGDEKAEAEENKPLDVASLPFAPSGMPTGRELVFLPALIEIIQQYIDDSLTSDRTAYAGWGFYSKRYLKAGDKTILIADDDLAEELETDPEWESKNIFIKDTDKVDEIFSSGAPGTLISYTVAPNDPQRGAVCYKMLITADTHELYYYSKNQISGSFPAGFLDKDLKLLSFSRKIK